LGSAKGEEIFKVSTILASVELMVFNNHGRLINERDKARVFLLNVI
jgi:hypothetical protein